MVGVSKQIQYSSRAHMIIISFFLITALLFSLVSRRMEETIITAPMVFTIAGIIGMSVVANSGEFQIERNLFSTLAEIGLVMTLFVDATHVNSENLGKNYKLPLRLLGIGMLPTILLGGAFALLLFPSLSIWEAGVVGAILAPTDAGLGQIIVNSPKVPQRIRHALNVEAGLNDGLSVPFMMFFVAVALEGTSEGGPLMARLIMEQLGLGVVVGFGVGLVG
ncbi:MAG TPA: cation:proton antiporter, partial [Desulfomonilaceae bacterium]|nr:cation:proton antiporter [Desulfomonilaceae bacterium]